jgi:uncharacterized membrane protein
MKIRKLILVRIVPETGSEDATNNNNYIIKFAEDENDAIVEQNVDTISGIDRVVNHVSAMSANMKAVLEHGTYATLYQIFNERTLLNMEMMTEYDFVHQNVHTVEYANHERVLEVYSIPRSCESDYGKPTTDANVKTLPPNNIKLAIDYANQLNSLGSNWYLYLDYGKHTIKLFLCAYADVQYDEDLERFVRCGVRRNGDE